MDDYPDRTQRSSALPATNIGNVAVVRGSVIDVYFPQRLPHIRNLLRTGEQNHIILEVLTQLDAQRVRAIALTPTAGLARGMLVEDTGAPLMAPVGNSILSRMFDVFGNPIDLLPPPENVEWRSVHHAPPSLSCRSTHSEVFITGIKVIDVLVPGTRR